MLEFRRPSNDRRTRGQLLMFGIMAAAFICAAVYCSAWTAAAAVFGVFGGVWALMCVWCIRLLMWPVEYICEFNAAGVWWCRSDRPGSVSGIAAAEIREMHLNFDDHQLSFNTGSLIARGIGADIEINSSVLSSVHDFCRREWPSVTICVIRSGIKTVHPC